MATAAQADTIQIFTDMPYADPAIPDPSSAMINKGTIGGVDISANAQQVGSSGSAVIGTQSIFGSEFFYVGDTNNRKVLVGQLISKTGNNEYGIWTNNGYFTGTINAVLGNIAGWAIAATTLSKNNAILDSSGKLLLGTGNDIVSIDAVDATYRLAIGHATYASAPFSVTKAGALYSVSGSIGSWSIGATSLAGGNATLSSTGILTLGTGNDIAALDAADATYRLAIGHATYSSAPFRVTKAGALTATSATITGAITATSGSIGSFTIGTYLYTGTKTAYNDANAGVHLGSDGIGIGNNVFTVSALGALVATSATITGSITATSGAIGGWTINSGSITDAAGTVGLSSVVTGGDDIRFWAGHVTPSSAPFQVTEAGVVTASSGTIGGWTLSATTLSGGSLTMNASSGTIGTTTFVSGQSGWQITGIGNAEFNNIIARGEFRTAVFVKNEVHATGGTMIVLGASILEADFTSVTSPSTSTMDVKDPPSGHAQLFAVNDILRIKDGSGKDNWLKVTAVSDQTTFYRYTVDKQSGTNGTFYKGTAVIDYKQSVDGYVLLTSDLSNSPYIDIGTNGATPWVSTTSKTRLGKLDGITDATFGALSGYGLWTNNGYFTGSIFATAGYFGDATTRVAIEAAGINVGTTGSIRGGQTAYDTGTGFWIGQVSSTPKFSLGNSAGNKLTWNGTTLAISGTVTATSGAIGGWSIGSTTLTGGNVTFDSAGDLTIGASNDVARLSATDSTYRLWIGHATAASAPFSVTKAGAVNMASTTVKGSVNVSTGGDIRSGQTAYRTGTGWFFEYNSGTPRSSIGVGGTGPEMYWDGTNLVATNINIVRSFTAGEDLNANDVVCPTGTNIVERVRPTSFASDSATFTEPFGYGCVYKVLKIDNTRSLHVGGGFGSTNITIAAVIGTVNAGETNMTYGSSYAFGGSPMVSGYFDVCQFDTYKFLVIYRSYTSGGTWAVVLNVSSSGNTITNGSPVQIKTTAENSSQVACAKIDSGKVLIAYQDTADTKTYVQVLSISGETITTNTQVELDSGTNTGKRLSLTYLTTNKLLCVYAADSSDPLVAKTIDISGTTPTVNGSNTLNSTSQQYTVGLAVINANKVVMAHSYNDGGGSIGVAAAILTISGSTVTKGTNLVLSSVSQTDYHINILALSQSVLLTTTRESDTQIKYHLLYVDGTTITSTTTVATTTSSNSYASSWICKFKPFKYLGIVGTQYGYVTLGSNSNIFIGTAFSTIADTASGSISMRYTTNTGFSGLTAGSVYYIDDSGTITTDTSTLSTVFGIALNTTSILVQ